MTRYAVYGVPGIDEGAPPVAVALRERVEAWYARHPSITVHPRRYSFHCTLKAPFRLADGVGPADLDRAVAALAAARPSVALEAVRPAAIGRFRALVATGDGTASDALAASVVRDLDHLRAPLDDADIARRDPDALTPRQRELLDRYGYPYVLDEFRLHMTLTDTIGDAGAGIRVLDDAVPGAGPAGPLDPLSFDPLPLDPLSFDPLSETSDVDRAIAAHFACFAGRDVPLTALSVFVEPEPGAPFEVRSVHPLEGREREAGAEDHQTPSAEEGANA